MNAVGVQFIGAEELQRTLSQLPLKVANAIDRKAIRAGSTIVLNNMRARVPRGLSGRLKKALGRRFKTYRLTSISLAIVGVRRKQEGTPTRYAHFTEFGTVKRKTKTEANRGAVPARPWMRPAFEGSKEQVRNVMARKMSEEVAKFGHA